MARECICGGSRIPILADVIGFSKLVQRFGSMNAVSAAIDMKEERDFFGDTLDFIEVLGNNYLTSIGEAPALNRDEIGRTMTFKQVRPAFDVVQAEFREAMYREYNPNAGKPVNLVLQKLDAEKNG